MIDRKRALIHSVEESLLDFYHSTPKAFWASLLLNFACHAAAIVEVYLIVWLMGTKLNLFGALTIEALTKLVNIAGTFNPGNIGTYEGGNMLITKMFGLTAAAGTATSMLHDLGLQTLPPQSLDGGLVQQNEIHDFTQGRSTSTVNYLASLFNDFQTKADATAFVKNHPFIRSIVDDAVKAATMTKPA